MDASYWNSLADDYVTAADPGVSKRALLLAMAVAEHETNNGRAWPGTFNFGAVQLRGLTSAEWAMFNAEPKQLNSGARYPGNPGGVLHIDTHPTPSGPKPYPVWFAAFPTQVDGIRYFLRTLSRLTQTHYNDPAATPMSVATWMYLCGYYEGAHAGGRPIHERKLPLLPAEQMNVNDYANSITSCLHGILPALGNDWPWFNPLVPPVAPPAPGQESGEVGADEGLPANPVSADVKAEPAPVAAPVDVQAEDPVKAAQADVDALINQVVTP